MSMKSQIIEILLTRLKLESAKSLNFSFNNFYLSQDDKLYIYTPDKKQVMGPITNSSNSETYNTHLLMTDEVIFEIVRKKGNLSKVILKKIGYGLQDEKYILDKVNDFAIEYTEQQNKIKTQLGLLNNCSTFSQTDFDSWLENEKSICQSITHHNYGNTGMVEANCNGFEDFEKNKRASVIIITHNCSTEEWKMHSGILINTVNDNNSANYCKSFVLTCGHCLAYDFSANPPTPQYYAVRFNWIRDVCDLSTLPDCQNDPQPWIDALNVEEVIDYTDVSLVSFQTGDSEFAFLEINDPLIFKEYYNGWRIPEVFMNPYQISSYAMGSSGSSPLVMREQLADISQDYGAYMDFYTANNDDALISGYSGSSYLDDNGYYLAFVKNGGQSSLKGQGVSIGLLYDNRPFKSLTIKPRNILDENEILKTQFDNRQEILVEGAERWEKGDCFKSAYDCASGFDMANFVTPVSNEDGLCCFKVEYVDPNTNFVGGKPFGLRVYRNTNKQETLHYSSGSAVFPNEESNYYEPLNGYLIDFCIASDELNEDNNTIIFEFLDNNGKIICRQEVEVYCFDPCETCPENIDSWLGLTTDENDPLCDEDECKVTFDFNIPEGYECFTHVSFSSTLDNAPFEIPTIVPASSFNISTLNKCIERGKEYKFTLKLMRGVDDPEPCVILDDAYCDLYDDNPPCYPDCPQTPWVRQPDAQVTLSGCSDCEMNISYYSRVACGKHEIQITSIEKFGIGCNGANCDDIETYVEAVAKVMNDNEMGFPFPSSHLSPCLTTFRISKSSCWASATIGFYNPQNEFISIISLKPCNSDCCVREVTVCKDTSGNYTLSTTSATSYPSCHDATQSYPNTWTPCSYTCNFLNSTVTLKQSYSNQKEESEIKKFKEEMRNPNNTYVKIQVNNNNEILNVNIEETNGKNISIKLFDMTGRQINELSEPLKSTNNIFNLNLSNLISGSYLYSIEIDGKLAKSDNIIITR